MLDDHLRWLRADPHKRALPRQQVLFPNKTRHAGREVGAGLATTRVSATAAPQTPGKKKKTKRRNILKFMFRDLKLKLAEV